MNAQPDCIDLPPLQTAAHAPLTSTCQDAALRLDRYGAGFGPRVILADISLELAPTGVTVLMGPPGTGKSTLLRSLAGLNQANSRFREWGRALMNEQVLSKDHRPVLVQQQARLLGSTVREALCDALRRQPHAVRLSLRALQAQMEDALRAQNCEDLIAVLDQPGMNLTRTQQHRLSVLAGLLQAPTVLLVDEPTSGLAAEEAQAVLALLSQAAQHCAVLVALHQQQQARCVGQRVLLLAGGRLQADAPVPDFFNAPPNDLSAHFVRTGSCVVAAPDAVPEELADDVQPPPPLPTAALLAVRSQPEYRGPTGFRWIVPGRMGTCPLPGAVQDIGIDLDALRTVGVTLLITLTHNDLPQDALAAHGLRNLHLPIYDREAPTIAQLRMLAMRMTRLIQAGEVLAIHCRAGLGRTGTVAAGWLIHEGLTAQAALERLRAIEPGYVQTSDQEAFLHRLEEAFLLKV